MWDMARREHWRTPQGTAMPRQQPPGDRSPVKPERHRPGVTHKKLWLNNHNTCIRVHFAVKSCEMRSPSCTIRGVVGQCGAYEVFLGFASANLLHSVSFADVLDESTGRGYQRPRDIQHSASFRSYIGRPDSSTIPLTFNLRPDRQTGWRIERQQDGAAALVLDQSVKSLAQVDCQHRLGELSGSEVPLAFMAFIGLDLRSEMAMFTVINSKAKGLSSSLTDYHNSNLIADLFADAPHLYIARRLNDDPDSPWFKMIRLGGKPTPGLKRRTSLRMMQTAVAHFLSNTSRKKFDSADMTFGVVANFWRAVAQVFSAEWCDPRHHLLTKGVGLHSLMHIAAHIANHAGPAALDKEFFVKQLSVLKGRVDWRSNGEFSSAGGKKGVADVTSRLKEALQHANLVG